MSGPLSIAVMAPPMQRTTIAEAVAAMNAGQVFQYEAHMLQEVWDKAVDGIDWLWAVIAGEFIDHRPASVLVAEALAGFVPGVAIMQGVRDAAAIMLRLIAHPERRSEWVEWVLLSVNLVVVFLPVVSAAVSAAVGAAAAGVGAIGGAIGGLLAGSELAAFVRALLLLLVRSGIKLAEIVGFLGKSIKGDIVRLLKAMKFDVLVEPLCNGVKALSQKCVLAIQAVRTKLEKLLAHAEQSQAGRWLADHSTVIKQQIQAGLQPLRDQIAKLAEWEKRFYGFQEDALKNIPKLLTEWQARLLRVLAETLPRDQHLVASGVKAPQVTAAQIQPQLMHSTAGKPLRELEDKMLSQAAEGAPGGGTAKGSASAKSAADVPPIKYEPDLPQPAQEGLQNVKRKGGGDSLGEAPGPEKTTPKGETAGESLPAAGEAPNAGPEAKTYPADIEPYEAKPRASGDVRPPGKDAGDAVGGARGIGNVGVAGETSAAGGAYIPRGPDGAPIPLPQRAVPGVGDVPLPLPEAEGAPHTVLGGKLASDGETVYRQSATFPGGTWPPLDGTDVPWGRVDWSDHGYLPGPPHPDPHIHEFSYDPVQKQWQIGPAKSFWEH